VVYGTRGRLTIETPFNPAADRPTRLLIDDGRDLYGSGVEVESVPAADQYALQLDAFSEAMAHGRAPPFGIDDAITNMRALDALFRSERSGCWERP
jgi:predicted dehydrogenase